MPDLRSINFPKKLFPEKKLGIAIILSIFFSLGSWVLSANTDPVYDCANRICASISLSPANEMHFVESASLSFTILKDLQIYTGQQVSSKQFSLFLKDGSPTLYIPMRDGSTSAFPVILPKNLGNGKARVLITTSQEFTVLLNNLVVYTHRYQTPVFFFSTQEPLSTGMLIEVRAFNYSVKLLKLSRIKEDIAFLSYLISASLIGMSLLLRSKKSKGIKFPSTRGFPIILMIFFWGLSVIRWLLKPSDNTGGLRPGPFGPVGPFYSDVYQVIQSGSHITPYQYGATDYPPFAAAIGQLSRFLPSTLLVFGLLTFTIFLFCLPLKKFDFSKTSGNRTNFLIILIFSYPLIFGLIRGNFDLLATALTLVAMFKYKEKHYLLSFLALSFAISLKYWPVLFVLIYLRDRQFKLVLKTLAVSAFTTVISCITLDYRHVSEIFIVSSKAILDYGTGKGNLSSYSFSYSLNSILLVGAIFVLSRHPLNPTHLELTKALDISQGVFRYIAAFILLLILIYLIRKSLKLSSMFLMVSASTLLFPSTSATYRAAILVACLVIRALEGEKIIWRFAGNLSSLSLESKKLKVFQILEICAWLFVLSPSDFLYQRGTFFSTASILQPLSVLMIVFLEYLHLRSRIDSPKETNLHD